MMNHERWPAAKIIIQQRNRLQDFMRANGPQHFVAVRLVRKSQRISLERGQRLWERFCGERREYREMLYLNRIDLVDDESENNRPDETQDQASIAVNDVFSAD